MGLSNRCSLSNKTSIAPPTTRQTKSVGEQLLSFIQNQFHEIHEENMTKSLAKKQETIYKFISDYSRSNKRAPSQLEISKATGIQQSNIGKYLKLIEQKGFISWYPFEPRGIKVTRQPN
jgi:DNA-binding MarR family transcriptional regulator